MYMHMHIACTLHACRIHRLSADDRALFSLVTEATLANPFGERRARLDAEIAAGAAQAAAPGRARARRGARDATRERGPGPGRALRRGRPRSRLLHAALRRLPPLPARVRRPRRRPSASGATSRSPCRFAGEALALLGRRGFSAEEARRFLGLFYQLRRAFFFIDRSLVGRSASMRALRERLWRNLFSDDLRCYARYLWNRMEDFSTLLLGRDRHRQGRGGDRARPLGLHPLRRAPRRLRRQLHARLHRDQPLAVPGDADRVGAVRPPQGGLHGRDRRTTRASSRAAARTARSSWTRSATSRSRSRSSCSRSCRSARSAPSAATRSSASRGA